MNGMRDALEEKVDARSKITFILDVIRRYDGFTISTNFKASVIIAFNTLIVGSILIKFIDIVHASNIAWVKSIVSLLLFFLSMSSLISLFFVFRVIYPFFKAQSIKDEQQISLIYFQSVSQLTSQDYFNRLENSSYEDLIKDLAEQATILASGLNKKMIDMRHSIEATITSLTLILLLVFLQVFFHSSF
jgi:hypothetical protein